MTLKELKKMIAEEYTAFMKEQAGDMPDMPGPGPMGGPGGGPAGGPTVNVSDDDIDVEEGDKDAESTLKTMFDIPSLDNVSEVIVDVSSVRGESQPIIVHSKSENKSKSDKTSAA